MLKQFDEAHSTCQREMSLAPKAQGPQSVDVSLGYYIQGQVLFAQARFSEAESALARARGMMEKLMCESNPNLAELQLEHARALAAAAKAEWAATSRVEPGAREELEHWIQSYP